MRALDRKLLRDLARLWLPALAISMVLACGIMTQVSMKGAETTLVEARADFYQGQGFADLFASAAVIPASALKAVADLPDIAAAEGRTRGSGRFESDGAEGTVELISLPAPDKRGLNRPLLRSGWWPGAGTSGGIVLSEAFATANKLGPGDTLDLTVAGKAARFRVTGTVLSPEFLYATPPGSAMPDDQHHGIVFMPAQDLQALLGKPGQLNDLVARLRPGGSAAQALFAIDRILEPYGGRGAYGRGQQPSDVFLSSELRQLQALSTWLPPVFLIVSAFLVNMVLDRLIRLERPEIGLLKAVGYGNARIVAHYLALALGIGLPGILGGWVAGWALGEWMIGLYRQYFRFPELVYGADMGSVAQSGLLGAAALVAGATGSALASARLSPATAMSPPVPPHFARGMAEPLGRILRLGRLAMMVVRSVFRQPLRAGTTLLGVSAAAAILVASFFTFDVIDVIMRDIFTTTNRQDLTIALDRPADPVAAVRAVRAMPGVMMAEAERVHFVRITHGAQSRLMPLRLQTQPDGLVRSLGADERVIALPPAGVLLPERLAADWGLVPGDVVQVDLLDAPRRSLELPFRGVVRQSLGQEAQVAATAFAAALGEQPLTTAVVLRLDPARRAAFDKAAAASPGILAVTDWHRLQDQFQAEVNDSLLATTLVFSLIGMLITLGVVYNAARIQLAERSHELATLRVLGFSLREVAMVLVGELMFVVALAIPPGLLAGLDLAALMAERFSSDIVTMPLVIDSSTYAITAVIVLGTAFVTAVLVAAGLRRVDLVQALKSRD